MSEEHKQAEPVAWLDEFGNVFPLGAWVKSDVRAKWKPLYSAPKAQPAPAVQPQWQPIESAPKDGRKIILSYRNGNDLPRTVMAVWVSDEEAAENDEDGVGLLAGWYESIDNWDDYTQVAIHAGEPTHWMPLPATPGNAHG